MRVLIYGLNYAPELTGIGKYTSEMAAWLSRNECDVRVVTTPMYYPAWKIGPGFKAFAYRAERNDGVNIIRCPLYVPSRTSGLRRCIHLASFAVFSLPIVFWQALTWRPDVVFVVAPTLLCAPIAWLAARLAMARCWLHYQDLEIDAAISLKIIRGKILEKIALQFERWLLRRFDQISTISNRMLEKLRDKGAPDSRLVLLPNWVDTRKIFPSSGPNPLRSKLGISQDSLIALYSGSMNEKSGLDLIAKAALQLKDEPRIQFILCGDGPARTRIEKMTEGLSNVRFLPLQPAEQLNELLNMADIHLLPQQPGAADLVMPSKLTAILSSGRAIVGAALPQTEIDTVLREISAAGCPATDANAWAEVIRKLLSDSKERLGMGVRARAYALKHCDKQRILTSLAHKLLLSARDSCVSETFAVRTLPK